MANVLLFFKGGSYVYDYALLSRDLSFVRFDGLGTKLNLLRESINGCELTLSKSVASPVVSFPLSEVKNYYNPTETDFDENGNHITKPLCRKHRRLSAGIELSDVQLHFNGQNRVFVSVHNPPFELYNLLDKSMSEIVNIYEDKLICVTALRRAVFTLDSHVASCLGYNLRCSRKFRLRFLKWVKRQCSFRSSDYPVDSVDVEYMHIPYSIEIRLEYPVQEIDYCWSRRTAGLASKRVMFEDTMAWLNTLGGGFSALGDYFQHHAKEAGKISLKQLKIAVDMGDPITAAKCRIFYALSLTQQGNTKDGRKIVRMQYRFAMRHSVKDERLIAMCISLWNRLRYLKLEAKKSKVQPSVIKTS